MSWKWRWSSSQQAGRSAQESPKTIFKKGGEGILFPRRAGWFVRAKGKRVCRDVHLKYGVGAGCVEDVGSKHLGHESDVSLQNRHVHPGQTITRHSAEVSEQAHTPPPSPSVQGVIVTRAGTDKQGEQVKETQC